LKIPKPPACRTFPGERFGAYLPWYAPVLLMFVFVAFVASYAQEAPTITDKDIVTLSPAQVEALQAYQAFQPLRDRAYADVDARLQATKEFKRLAAANAELERAANEVYKAHGLKPADYFICYGPAEGPCKDAPEKKYVWRKAKNETASGAKVINKEVAEKKAPKAK
jgi:hypothetical protein